MKKPDINAISSLLERLDIILGGPKAEMLPRLRELAQEVDRIVPYYDGHMIRVTFYSVAIGLNMKLPREDLLTLEVAALLHDFGKLGVEESTLDKEERLSDEEFAEIQHHAERGFHILSGFNQLSDVAGIIRDHHERFDGTGYPRRKHGHDISLMARIIAVADSYDAMTTSRPYRRRLTHEQAQNELIEQAGKQFDPEVVHHFIDRVGKRKLRFKRSRPREECHQEQFIDYMPMF
ncbi:MAG: HD-GYP domain-containing protein [Candidatus Edwardsbacteria bacterium]|nr:HD-GYP domain-containing protein [Candidatus Edwardsbacteria bacterium]